MVDTTLPGVLLPAGAHASRPAANAVASGTLYPCTTHALIYQSDGVSTWTTWATLGTAGALTDQGVITYLDGTVAAAPATPATGKLRLYAKTGKVLAVKDDAGLETVLGTGIADQGAFTYLDATDGAAPANPAAGHARVYSKAGRIYSRDSSGVEYGPFDAAGAGAGPKLYVDTLALHASGDDFTSTVLTGWTVTGVTAAAITTETYDATCLDLTFATQSDRMFKAVPSGIAGSGNYEITLTVYGMNNDASSPTAAAGSMTGLYFSDNSGNGTGFSMYNDQNMYMWAIAANAYNTTGPVALNLGGGLGFPYSSEEDLVYKLKRVGTTITGSVSINGGTRWSNATRTDATTFTRMGIIRLYSGGGTNPRIRVGRFNVTEL